MTKSSFKSEKEMRIPIINWLIKRGLNPEVEVKHWGKVPDVVGYDDGFLEIAVEMKLSDWKRALYQATTYTLFAHESYVAMPENKKTLISRKINEFNRWGVGILIVKNNQTVEVLNPARLQNKHIMPYRGGKCQVSQRDTTATE